VRWIYIGGVELEIGYRNKGMHQAGSGISVGRSDGEKGKYGNKRRRMKAVKIIR
jgi:hypothetical protein